MQQGKALWMLLLLWRVEWVDLDMEQSKQVMVDELVTSKLVWTLVCCFG